jgi:hypothetical protein
MKFAVGGGWSLFFTKIVKSVGIPIAVLCCPTSTSAATLPLSVGNPSRLQLEPKNSAISSAYRPDSKSLASYSKGNITGSLIFKSNGASNFFCDLDNLRGPFFSSFILFANRFSLKAAYPKATVTPFNTDPLSVFPRYCSTSPHTPINAVKETERVSIISIMVIAGILVFFAILGLEAFMFFRFVLKGTSRS